MITTTKVYLLFMIVPLFLAVLFHFLVPLEYIMISSPKIQESYNSRKIQVELKTKRAMAFSNSRVASNRLQMYQNVKTSLIRLLDLGDRYQKTNVSHLILNNAYQLANSRENSNFNLNRTMWFIEGISIPQELNPVQQYLIGQYANIEPFISALLENSESVYPGLYSMQVCLQYLQEEIYFEYPSKIRQQFSSLNTSALSDNFLITLDNYLQNGHIQTTIINNSSFYMCSLLFDEQEILGSQCIAIETDKMVSQITNSFEIKDFQLSTSQYFLLRPVYDNNTDSLPEVIAQFSPVYEQQIRNMNTFDLRAYEIETSLLDAQVDYKLYIQRVQKFKTLYLIPLSVISFYKGSQIVAYLLMVDNFEKAGLQNETMKNQILLAMILLSSILLVVSLLLIGILCRKLFKELQKILNKLIEYCILVLKGDLKLQIQSDGYTQDLQQLFEHFERLNKLSKYSEPKYFDSSKHERIIRYLQAYQFFNKHGYNCSNICENIGECYYDIGQKQNALRYIKKALEAETKKFEDKYGPLPIIFQKKLKLKTKLDRETRVFQKRLTHTLQKYTYYLYQYCLQEDIRVSKLVFQCLDTLKSLIYPDILTINYINALIIENNLKLKLAITDSIDENFERVNNLLNNYEEKYTQEPHKHILRSQWCLIFANFRFLQKKFLEAYWLYVQGLNGSHFNPVCQARIMQGIQQILLEVDKNLITSLTALKFVYQLKPRVQREYVFMIDVSNPDLTREQTRTWKKKNREIANKIYESFITPDDKVSIYEFCSNIQKLCDTVYIKNYNRLIKKQLRAGFKSRRKPIFSQALVSFRSLAAHFKHRNYEKILISFLKPGVKLNGNDLFNELKCLTNSRFVFIMQDGQAMENCPEEFYRVNYSGGREIECILESKQIVKGDNQLYIFQ